MLEDLSCPVCKTVAAPFDVLDFSRPCKYEGDQQPRLSGHPVYYYVCFKCGFCFAPEFWSWTQDNFKTQIYNEEYIRFDPDYLEKRPKGNVQFLTRLFEGKVQEITHLDYGGGDGSMSKILSEIGWDSKSFDPFEQDAEPLEPPMSSFNLVTAFEVFEHVPDVHLLMKNLMRYLSPGGIILFSTLLSDGHISPGQRLTWWYVAPRNGHISIFSTNSLVLLARAYGFQVAVVSEGVFIMYTIPPEWCSHFLK